MSRIFIFLFLLLFLTSCSGITIPQSGNTEPATPSNPPKIISPTPPYLPSNTPISPDITQDTATPTQTTSPTPEEFTPTSTLLEGTPTITPIAGLRINILECNTSLDILHQLGEVTNAYPRIQNDTGLDLTNVCATLSASDEDRLHPDKTNCLALLPDGYQVTFKLTVDTGFEQDSSIRVDVTDDQGFTVSSSQPSCLDIGIPGWAPSKIGVIEPIP